MNLAGNHRAFGPKVQAMDHDGDMVFLAIKATPFDSHQRRHRKAIDHIIVIFQMSQIMLGVLPKRKVVPNQGKPAIFAPRMEFDPVDFHPMDHFVFDMLITRHNTWEAIIGLTCQNENRVTAGNEGFADGRDHKIFGVVILANDKDSHGLYYLTREGEFVEEYNLANMLAKRLHENKLKRALVAPWRNLVKTLSPVAYVKYQYRYITHHKLNLKNPVRYTRSSNISGFMWIPKTRNSFNAPDESA